MSSSSPIEAGIHSASLRFENATIGYDGHPAVHHVEGCFGPGSLTAVVGPNGAGKSTLLKAAIGVLRPLGGKVTVTGCPRRRIAYLPQQSEIDRSFPIPVFDFVAMGLWRRTGLFGGFGRTEDERVASALAAVGLDGFERRTLDTLSGGQFQRVLFARVILQDSSLILLDEPFAAVDERTVDILLSLVVGWHAQGRTIVAVLHDHEQVRTVFPETLLIARHVIAWGATDAVLTPVHLRAARNLEEAWDEAAPVCHADEVPA